MGATVGEDDDARPEELHQPPLDQRGPGIAEHERFQAGPGGVCRQRRAVVSRRRRHGLPEAELPGHGEGHRMEPVLERPRRVPRLVLQPDAGALRPRQPDERRGAFREAHTRGARRNRQELAEPPQAAGTGRPRTERSLCGERGIVVDDLERRARLGGTRETALEGGAERRGRAAADTREVRGQDGAPGGGATTPSSLQPPPSRRSATAVPGLKWIGSVSAGPTSAAARRARWGR